MKSHKVNEIIVTQYFETLNQFQDTQLTVLNVSESIRIHLKLMGRLHLTLTLNPSQTCSRNGVSVSKKLI